MMSKRKAKDGGWCDIWCEMLLQK